ncbi:hypothetical protein ABZ40_13680 [Listeria monocytogenes]|nr:hypothetical protein [Listeria monocytogenes]
MNDDINKKTKESIDSIRKITNSYYAQTSKNMTSMSNIRKFSNPAYETNKHLKHVKNDISEFNQTTTELAKEIKAEMKTSDSEIKKIAWKIAFFSAILGGTITKILDLLFNL